MVILDSGDEIIQLGGHRFHLACHRGISSFRCASVTFTLYLGCTLITVDSIQPMIQPLEPTLNRLVGVLPYGCPDRAEDRNNPQRCEHRALKRAEKFCGSDFGYHNSRGPQ